MATMDVVKRGPITRLRIFLDEVKKEMAKVTWPTLDELKVSTKVTMIMLLLMAAIILGFDLVFNQFITLLLKVAT